MHRSLTHSLHVSWLQWVEAARLAHFDSDCHVQIHVTSYGICVKMYDYIVVLYTTDTNKSWDRCSNCAGLLVQAPSDTAPPPLFNPRHWIASSWLGWQFQSVPSMWMDMIRLIAFHPLIRRIIIQVVLPCLIIVITLTKVCYVSNDARFFQQDLMRREETNATLATLSHVLTLVSGT